MSPSLSVQRKSLTILLAVTVGAPIGCQRYLEPAAPPSHRGATVRVVCPAAVAGLIRVQTRVWASRQEATVEVVEYAADRAPDQVGPGDVWIVPPSDLPRWAAADKLLSVPTTLTDRGGRFDWNGLLPLYREQLAVWDRQAFGVPLVGEAPVCLFRADLFASAQLREKFHAWRGKAGAASVEFRSPASWQEFAALAEFFHDHHPSGKPGPSLPPLPADPTELDRRFYQLAAPFARRAIRQDEVAGKDHLAEVFAFHYDLATGKPRVQTEGFVAALRLMARLQLWRPQGTSPDPGQAFLDGQAVLAIADASLIHEAQKRPALRDKVGVAPVPGSQEYYTPNGGKKLLREGANRVPYLGEAGWLAVVPKASRHPEAAWDLLADLAGPARSAQVAMEPAHGGGPTRTDQVRRDRWDSFDLDLARSQALRDALARTVEQHGLKNPVICLRIPTQASHRQAMVAGLRQVLLDKGDPATALREVAGRWAELDAKRGAAHLADYRISLGLSKD